MLSWNPDTSSSYGEREVERAKKEGWEQVSIEGPVSDEAGSYCTYFMKQVGT
jgi:hypothetical protein